MGKDKLSREDKKALAYDLFMNTDKTQNEICDTIGIAPKTMTKWKQDGLWEELKGATTITANNIITNIYKKMHEMTLEDKLNADALAKLARVIEVVSDKKYTISQVFNVLKEFTNWLFPKDAELAKALNKHMKVWVDELING
jgi:DNA-binding XRE family transcriptional regulator